MKETTTSYRRRRRARGTALIEFTLSIPLLAVVIGTTFFFGWSLTNKQHVVISDRYTTWRNVRTGDVASQQGLNDKFFADRSDNVDINLQKCRPEQAMSKNTMQDFIAACGAQGGGAGAFVQGLANNMLPKAVLTHVSANFPTDVGIYQRFTGAIASKYSREGVEWRNGDKVYCEQQVRDQFLADFDNNLPPAGGRLNRVIRVLYNYKWAQVQLPDENE